MTIWIDPPAWPAHGRLWSHLVSDSSLEELHRFAAGQGIPARGFEGDHYDVPEELYAALVAAGAREVDGRGLLRLLQGSGLRIPKRRHERVVHSFTGPGWLPAGSRADVIASRQDSWPANTVVVRLLAMRQDAVLVVPREDGSLDLPRRVVGAAGPEQALSEVQAVALGAAVPAPLLGYVRNTVPEPDPAYLWPAPRACFAVSAREVDDDGASPLGGARWVPLGDTERHLGSRHWWPLLPEYLRRRGAGPP